MRRSLGEKAEQVLVANQQLPGALLLCGFDCQRIDERTGEWFFKKDAQASLKRIDGHLAVDVDCGGQ